MSERAQGSWGTIYLVIVFIIAALLLVAVVKPMFQQSQTIAQDQPVLNQK